MLYPIFLYVFTLLLKAQFFYAWLQKLLKTTANYTHQTKLYPILLFNR
ncbi:hypothetical protein ENHY17A_30310 [Moraxellaceae bacterium 17A]|nr:hypothetical protein ENHY17A_30310 [Moraxellaceae bacterium 17A]